MATILSGTQHSYSNTARKKIHFSQRIVKARIFDATAWVWKRWQAIGGFTAILSVAYTMFTLQQDMANREITRINQAWSLIAAAKVKDVGNIGLVEVLEYLHRREVSLAEIQLPGAHLYQAALTGADLNVAILRGANLIEAKLGGTILHTADLRKANLFNAILSQANLQRANLTEANLRSVDFRQADLRNADLTDATSLTQSQLDTACGDESTVLPLDMTIPSCVETDWWEDIHSHR